MQWSTIQVDPPRAVLRQFAAAWLAVFAGLACWQGFARDHLLLALLFAGLAITIGPLGLAIPRFIRPIYVAAMIAAFPIGWTVSQIILASVFYGIFTPLGIVFRLAGRDALLLKFRPHQTSYWQPKPGTADMRRYFRQF